MKDFLSQHFDKIILAVLIVFFGFMGAKYDFAAKECDTLVGGFGVLLVQKVAKAVE